MIPSTLAPCKYLGLQIAAGRFEPDPSQWASRCYNTARGKQSAKVCFEWVRAMNGNEKHRVVVRADYALDRGIPRCPLDKSAQSGLRFSMEFMDAAAEKNKAGMIFEGTAES